MASIDILIVEEDVATQRALLQVLGSEGWNARVAGLPAHALQELAARAWTLAIASVNLTGFSTPLYTTLKELALAPVADSGKPRLRVLFMVPEDADPQARPILESAGLPYVAKPFHLHDFLERVSDLLLESEAIAAPIRQVRQDRKQLAASRREQARRNSSMFADYSEYVMTEEEIAEYERQESEDRENKKKKQGQLGSL